jgi:tetratricopeptide (TPR) repeat protein
MLTIQQALQQAIEAHQAGRLQDAEASYRAILKDNIKHPDANHNLGVLAVSLNKAELAVSLFKTALEANPNHEQFWLSYLDALIKTNQLEIAKGVLEQGKKLGLKGERVAAIEAQLTPTQRPSKEEINSLLEHYQNGRYDVAENLAKTITQKYPDHQFTWKILGAVFQHVGKIQESLTANQRAIMIAPNDAEAHNNLGNILQELGRSEDAKLSYKKAITIKPDYAEAHNNLGVTLRGLGRLEEAVDSYNKTIRLKSSFTEAYINLAITLKELGKMEEAIASYKIAISLKPDYAQVHCSLGITLQEMGRFSEAEESYKKAISIKSDYSEAYINLGINLQELGRFNEAEESYKKAIASQPGFAEAYFNLGTALQKLGRLREAETNYKKAIEYKPDYAEAHCNLGATLNSLGRPIEAEESFKKTLTINPELTEAKYNLGAWFLEQGNYKQAAEKLMQIKKFKRSGSYLLKCLYFLDEKDKFYKQLDSLINRGEIDAILGSFSCRAEVKYGLLKSNSFCNNPLNYVFETNLKKNYDFKDVFVKAALNIFNNKKIYYRAQNLLTNGLQTEGNLFNSEDDQICEIKKIILLEIEKYRIHFKNSNEGFIKNWPKFYDLYGWLISIKSGGELRPHMHENGWISGSIYINVPPKLNSNDGNLVVCIEDDNYLTDLNLNPKSIVDVNTGSLCLFPASLLHYTIPFESDEERVVLAFDVVPENTKFLRKGFL